MTTAIAGVAWIVWVVVLPLAAATALLLSRQRAAWPGVAAACAIAGAVAGLTWRVWRDGPQRYRVGGWGAPLGIDLYADGLSLCMLLLTAVIGVSVSVYAAGYLGDRDGDGDAPEKMHPADFWTLWLFLWAALNALFLSGDIFNLYVTLELTTMAAVGLVTLARTSTALAAALGYLLAALLGSLFYLLGIALLYAEYGVLDVASLGRVMTPGAVSAAAVSLMAMGLAVKAALFPLHFWLPPAHASAPAPVSAVLSGLVVKASFYVLLRLWFDAFPPVVSASAGMALASLGAGAIAWGSVQALVTPGLKPLVAYSTVAQLGYLFLVFGLESPGERSGAWTGAILFGVSHGCAKAAMFLAAGSILHVAGHDQIADLHGVGRRLPITFFTIAVASVTLMGLPPSGAFVAKWMLLEAAIAGGHFWLAAIVLAGGLLAAGYLFRILGQAFTTSRAETPLVVPRSMEWTPLALAVVALLLGFFAAPVLAIMQLGAGVISQASGATP